jgi:hypothetical protein
VSVGTRLWSERPENLGLVSSMSGDFALLSRVQPEPRVHPASYSLDIVDSFPEAKLTVRDANRSCITNNEG